VTRKLAVILTNWENHRTQIQWDNNFLTKVFLFYFLTAYTSLFYLAYFKNAITFWGVPKLKDSCKSGRTDYRNVSGGCADELTLQLVSLLMTNLTIGNTKEVLIPWIISKVKLYLYQKSVSKEKMTEGETQDQIKDEMKNLPQWERESKLGLFEGTFDEYSEMVIQYGYVTMFASAFALAPLLAVLNNMIEVRTDAFKIISSYSRPIIKQATGIGHWYAVLEIISIIAVINNCFLIGFAFEPLYVLITPLVTSVSNSVTYLIKSNPSISNEIRVLVLAQLDDQRFWKTAFAVFAVIAILEHVLFFVKFVIGYIIPDTPGWVTKQIALQAYLQVEQFRKQKGIVRTDFTREDIGADEDLDKNDDIDVDAVLKHENQKVLERELEEKEDKKEEKKLEQAYMEKKEEMKQESPKSEN